MGNRILALIDGFNYYHKLDNYQKKFKSSTKWINYRSLVESFLKENDDKVNATIVYFSALAHFRGTDSVQRHQTFISALRFLNIEAVLGNFKYKEITKCNRNEKCNNCTNPQNGCLQRHEEKESDVNIAIRLIEDTILDKYDKCFLLSGDSDFVSVVKRAKELRADKKIIIVPPPPPTNKSIKPSEYRAQSLAKASQTNALLIDFQKIISNQLPDIFHGFINPWK
ncbi:NYN domain-containing protein [Endomicrobium proavitum]|uniref:NYN domain-containing protein n=1 Tax=Endomicrobium proavitum TaxID=1408281 RepID=A0A0G3WMB2_9BACT|nr:NYN domain-containing protein [Endomicrobium proavitum]AKL98619.1 hypothetical protein Epro_1240 [Endomicrobium proavitum]